MGYEDIVLLFDSPLFKRHLHTVFVYTEYPEPTSLTLQNSLSILLAINNSEQLIHRVCNTEEGGIEIRSDAVLVEITNGCSAVYMEIIGDATNDCDRVWYKLDEAIDKIRSIK